MSLPSEKKALPPLYSNENLNRMLKIKEMSFLRLKENSIFNCKEYIQAQQIEPNVFCLFFAFAYAQMF